MRPEVPATARVIVGASRDAMSIRNCSSRCGEIEMRRGDGAEGEPHQWQSNLAIGGHHRSSVAFTPAHRDAAR